MTWSSPSRDAIRDRLLRLVDPEWVPFIGFMLLPSLVAAFLGYTDRAVFFARLALHAGMLKWLGWMVLTRSDVDARSLLKFPGELVIGLTLSMLWFYLRNVVAAVAPGSYSLVELSVVAWFVMTLQIVGVLTIYGRSIRRHAWTGRAGMRTALVRSCVYGPFALTLVLTLWSVSNEIFVPSQDGWFHSFIARVYLNDGILYKHFNGGEAIFYTSGFGGLNAVTAAASGLTVVQAHNLQHIFWNVTGMFLVTTTVALLAGRMLLALHAVPLLFLSAYPVHNLPPHIHWTHSPQQAAAALLVAIPLLSLLLPTIRRGPFYAGLALQAFLGVVVLALSPVCAFFLPLSCGIALVTNAIRARHSFREGAIKIAATQAALTLLAAVLVLGSDRYYSRFLSNPVGAGYMSSSQFGGQSSTGHRLMSFSPAGGLTAAATVRPFELMRELGEASPVLPGRFLPFLVLWLAVFAGALAAGYWKAAPVVMRQFAIAVGVSSVAWIGVKYGATFTSGGITNASTDAILLQHYLLFLGRRIELLLLFATAVLAVVCVYVAPSSSDRRGVLAAFAAGGPAMLMVWWLPLADTHLDPRDGQIAAQNSGVAGRITKDDIELTRWIEQNLPPGQGLVGIANVPFKSATGDAEFLFPIGASQSLSLYGKQYNFTFQIFDPSRRYGYDDYVERIVNYFDADWCVKNGIRYFHLPRGSIWPNYGLARARQVGLLQPIKTVSSSEVYVVRPLPWTPVAVPGPSKSTASHQVLWHADGTGTAQGNDGHVVFALKEPTFVHAIRFKYTLTNPLRTAAASQLFWSRGTQPFTEEERTAHLRLEDAATPQTLTILVHDTIDRFRFDPDMKPCTFRIWDIELLTKPLE